jgi:hypothetical protein
MNDAKALLGKLGWSLVPSVVWCHPMGRDQE